MAVDKYQGHFIRPKYFHTPFFYFFPQKYFGEFIQTGCTYNIDLQYAQCVAYYCHQKLIKKIYYLINI